MNQLDVKHLSYTYPNGQKVLNNLSFTLSSDDIVGIQAPSGYGKSTLAKMLGHYLEPSQGEIKLNDEPLPKKGFQPVQVIQQHPELTLNPLWKISKSLTESWSVDQEMMDILGIKEEWLDKWPMELSGGQLQRISIARALHPDTRYIIADEITSNLDAVSQVQIWQALVKLKLQRGFGLIVFSHNEALINQICTRIINLAEINQL